MIGALFALWLAATAPAAMLGCPDADGDDVCDAVDNCPAVPNPNQAIPVKLSSPIAIGGNVLGQDMSADGLRVVYRGDQDTLGVNELYSVALAGGPVTKLNAPLVANGDVDNAATSPDSARVVYRADQDVDGLLELYSVPIAGGPVVKLSKPAPLSGVLETFAVSPDGSRVVFSGAQETENVRELYSVPIAGGTIVKLSTGGYVSDFVIGADGSRVLYRSTNAGFNPNLFSVPLAGGPSVQLNGPLVLGGSVESPFSTSPDGARTLYRADQDVDARTDLYSVPTAGGTPTNLTSSFPATADCQAAVFSPDGSTVLFRESGSAGLYVTPATGGFLTLLFSGTPGGFQFSPDGQYVAFQAGTNGWVYSVPASGGTPVRLNGEFFGVGGRGMLPPSVQEVRVTPDSSRVVYRRPTGKSPPHWLYSTPTPGGTEIRIDGGTTEVFNYVLVPADGSRVVFSASEPSVIEGLFLTSTAGSSLVYNLTPAAQDVNNAVTGPEVDPSGTVATYIARTAPSSPFELYRVNLTVDADGVDRDRDGAGGACDPGDNCDDLDGDGLASCAGDCNDANPHCLTDCTDTDGDLACDPQDCAAANPARYPGAPEVNNGADEQCPGDLGYGAIDEVTGRLVFNTRTLVCWTPQSGATDYELAQATNRQLTSGCTPTALVGTCHDVFDAPAPILYYLVRATAPNAGSWGQTSAGVERTVTCP